MADVDVEVVLRLIDKLSQPAQQAAARMQELQQTLSTAGRAMQSIGRSMTLSFTLPAAGMVKQAVDFDTAMGNLAKVFSGTQEQLAATQRQIMEMARVLPLAQSELAKLFTAANQANIPLREQADFVRLASEFMVAFDTSAAKAADSLARLKTSQDLSVQGLRELAGVMNIIANNSAATEPEMLRLADRIAALGKVAGGDGAVAPLMALGGAAVSMGVDVERVSTALRNMLLNLTAGEGGTKRMKEALQSLGLEAGAVQQALSKDTVGTMLDIFKRIQELPRAGQLASLNDLFGRRAVDALGPLLSNLPEVVRLLGLVSDQQQRMSSVSDEFGKRMERMAPQFQLFMNSVRGISMTIAEHWIGPLTRAMEIVRQFLDSLTPGQQKFVAFAAGITAALGPVLIILGSVSRGVSALLAVMAALTTAFGTLRAGALAAGITLGTGGVAGAVAVLKTALMGLLRFVGPAGVIVLAANALRENWDKVSPAFNRVGDAVKNLVGQFTPLLDVINKIVEKITGSPIGELLNNAFKLFDNVVVETIVKALNGIAIVIETISSGIDRLKGLFGGLGAAMQSLPGFGGGSSPDANKQGGKQPLPGDGSSDAQKQRSQPGVQPQSFSPFRDQPLLNQALSRVPRGEDNPLQLVRSRINELLGSDRPATQAAQSAASGVNMPAGMALATRGPRIEIRQAPPSISNVVNVNVASSTQAPEAVGRAVARQMDRATGAGLYDGVSEV